MDIYKEIGNIMQARAIGFAEWIDINSYRTFNGIWYSFDDDGCYNSICPIADSTEELYELYLEALGIEL